MGDSNVGNSDVKQVWSELEALDEVMHQLGEDVSRLEGCLDGVLLPPKTEEELDKAQPSNLVPLAESIRNQRYRAANIRDAVESIMERLEI